MELVQESDLCIIDTTGHNPNVMYECGRRHETGKPYIMIARVGESLPFDINTIRTIFYDLKNPREVRSVVIAIQEIVGKLVQQGFAPVSTGDSLASLSEAIRRIERTLASFVGQGTVRHAGQAALPSSNATELLKKLSPVDALRYALAQRDPDLLDDLIPRIRNRVSSENLVTTMMPMAAARGSRVAIDALAQELRSIDNYEIDEQKRMVGSYITGMVQYDREADALQELDEFFEGVRRGEKPVGAKPEDRAFFLNQQQRLLYGVSNYDAAVNLGEQVLTLCPNDKSYIYNLSINYEYVGNLDKSLELVDRYMALIYSDTDTPDDDHLARAVKIYARAGLDHKAKEAFQQLQHHHPLRASIMADSLDVK